MLEKAHAVGVSAGKAAFFVAEKFAFHQIFRNRTAVDSNKGMVGAGRQLMDTAGSLLFTATGFA